jgi:putative peptide zinc metalloprotease protein
VTKVLHELGHALSCKHFGGECHELGVMLLVFTPCLYCNVSDSWMLPSKWRRIAITAAGMCVELVLAAACTFLWWFSQPGLLHTLCLNTMFVCSVSTLVLNGNPLLRYDGYFILSDLVDVPNLAQQSRALVRRWLARVCLGLESPQDRDLPERHRALLAAYAVASTLYRWAVVVGILWFCFRVVEPYRLDLLAEALTVVVFAGILAMPVANTVAFVRNPTQTRRIKRTRLLWTCGAVLAAAAGLWIVPLPFRVAAPVVLQAGGADHVYVSVPGTLLEALPAGAVVEPGETLARLENRELQMQVEELTGRCNQQRLHLENLQYRLLEDPGVGPQIPAAKEALADVEERLRRRQRDLEQLTLTAPAGGTVLPPADVAGHPAAPGQLQRWSGSPLDPRNRGCYLETGTLLCLVGDPSHLEAVLFVDQADLRFVSTGQRVEVQLDELPGEVLRGTIAEIAKADLKVVPRELAAGDSLPERIGRQGVAAGLETSYQARVRLDDHDRVLLAGSRGRAKVKADPQPLGQRLYRYLRRTFSFKL